MTLENGSAPLVREQCACSVEVSTALRCKEQAVGQNCVEEEAKQVEKEVLTRQEALVVWNVGAVVEA